MSGPKSRTKSKFFYYYCLFVTVIYMFACYLLYSWYVSGWRPCSKTCGKGAQTREVVCRQEVTRGKFQTLSDSKCTGNKPSDPVSRDCNKIDCPAENVPGDWSAVSEIKKVITDKYARVLPRASKYVCRSEKIGLNCPVLKYYDGHFGVLWTDGVDIDGVWHTTWGGGGSKGFELFLSIRRYVIRSFRAHSRFVPKPLIDSYLEGKNRSVNVCLKYLTRERMGRYQFLRTTS